MIIAASDGVGLNSEQLTIRISICCGRVCVLASADSTHPNMTAADSSRAAGIVSRGGSDSAPAGAEVESPKPDRHDRHRNTNQPTEYVKTNQHNAVCVTPTGSANHFIHKLKRFGCVTAHFSLHPRKLLPTHFCLCRWFVHAEINHPNRLSEPVALCV